MPSMPEEVLQAWNNKQDALVLTTVSKDGVPNSIYATCVSKYSNDTIVIADNYFDKTKKNILENPAAALLFITKDNSAYQLKGKIDYLTQGEIFDDMKKWNPAKHPGNAAAAFRVESVYSGSKKLL